MAIHISCACARRLKVADEFANKRVKCPSCGAVLVVPAKETDDPGFEVVEEDTPEAPETAATDQAKAGTDEEKKVKKERKKKRKTRSGGSESGSLSRMYEEQARAAMERDAARARSAGDWGRDSDGGWTLFGVHVTAGVLTGASWLILGLLATAFIAVFRNTMEIEPRIFVGSIVFTAFGAIILVRALFFGQED